MTSKTCLFCGKLRTNSNVFNWSRLKQSWYHTRTSDKSVKCTLWSKYSRSWIEGNKQTFFQSSKRSVCTVPSKWEQPLGYDTGIKVFHPIANEKVPLILKHQKIVQWYACGPTVYDSAHIGHASSYIRQDIIRRILEHAFGIDATLVMGITDIDDKIIQRSIQTNQDIGQVSRFYESEFFSDMSKLNILPPTMITRVTDHVPHIVDFIKGIEEQGFAYTLSDGSVYFDVTQYGKHGVFKDVPEIGESVPGRRNNKDFALWKAAKPGEPSWESPWGKGRPGWHIECSAMASKVFGANFDLHSGGEDLIYPHHENELAQSCAFHGNDQWVNYWLHTGHLHLSGDAQKMSKSLNNVISVGDVLANHSSNQFRMMCLLTNYRKKIEFSASRMDTGVAILKSFNSLQTRCDDYLKGTIGFKEIPEAEVFQRLADTRQAVHEAFADDFNTPRALARVDRFVTFMNSVMKKEAPNAQTVHSNASIAAVKVFMDGVLSQLGLDMGHKKTEDITDGHVQFSTAVDTLVSARDSIRLYAKDKDFFMQNAGEADIPEPQAKKLMKALYQPLWKLTDNMRKDLLDKTSVQIKDTKDDTEKSTWSIVEKESEERVQQRKEEIIKMIEGKEAKKRQKELKKSKMGEAPQGPNKKERFKKKKEEIKTDS